eukprot:7458221-Pyramimonas_sp.AAC.1
MSACGARRNAASRRASALLSPGTGDNGITPCPLRVVAAPAHRRRAVAHRGADPRGVQRRARGSKAARGGATAS